MTRAVSALAFLLTAAGLALVLSRIAYHARSEAIFEGPPRTFADARDGALELGEGALVAGQSVVFEVCSGDAFPPERWRGAVALEVWHATDGERVVESPFDDARLAAVRRGNGVGCVEVANAESLGVSGSYAIVARASERALRALAAVPIRGRIVASRSLGVPDLGALLLSLGAAVAWAIALALGPRRRSDLERELAEGENPSAARAPLRADVRAAIAWLALALALFGVGNLPETGPFAAVIGAAALAGVQLLAAFAFAAPDARETRRTILALGLDTRRSRALAALAPFAGLALVVAGTYAGALVPSTSESAIETFVASHSGYLAVAGSSVLLPIVEELFFRGLLYGLLVRAWGATAATVAVVLAFPLLHLPQVAGAWGALVSLTITGTGLTLLRRASGSVVPSAVAHLTHNAVIALMRFPLG